VLKLNKRVYFTLNLLSILVEQILNKSLPFADRRA